MPVYDKPMIYYPLSTLLLAGIDDILIITTPQDLSSFQRLLGDGTRFGIRLTYYVQPSPDGLAQAFVLGREHIGDDSVALIPQTSSLSSLPRGLVALIRLIEELGGAWGLRYTDQEQLIALAQRLFEAQELPSHELPDGLLPDWSAVDEQQLRPQGDEATEPGLLRRAPVQDAVELHAQQGPLLLLLRGEHFHTLAGLGPLIWSAASHWRRPEDLIAELSGLPGAPEDAGALLADAVEQLVEIGVLERSA